MRDDSRRAKNGRKLPKRLCLNCGKTLDAASRADGDPEIVKTQQFIAAYRSEAKKQGWT